MVSMQTYILPLALGQRPADQSAAACLHAAHKDVCTLSGRRTHQNPGNNTLLACWPELHYCCSGICRTSHSIKQHRHTHAARAYSTLLRHAVLALMLHHSCTPGTSAVRASPQGWIGTQAKLVHLATRHSQGWCALLSTQHCQQVVAEWISDVLAPVGVWALTGHVALHSEALQDRNSTHHSQARPSSEDAYPCEIFLIAP